MDQAILRAIVAPTKLAWKSQLGKDLISTYGIEEANATSFPGAVTAILTFSGEITGRILYILTEQTAKSVEAAFNSRWDDGLNQRTLDSVSDLMRPIVDNIPKLLETGGHKCAVELSAVLNTKGKGVAGGSESSQVIMLASLPDFDNPGSKDEISVWVMLEESSADSVSGSSGNGDAERESADSDDPGVAADESAIGGGSIKPGDGISQGEADLLNELQEEFGGDSEEPLFSDQDIADMMAAEEALAAGEPESGDAAEDAPSEEEKQPDGSETGDSEPDDGTKTYPAIHVGVITTEKLEIVDSEGRVRTVLATLRDGSPYLSIADATGRTRATLRLDSEGDAKLTFVDESGVETWMAPRDEPISAQELEPAHKRDDAAPIRRKPETPGPAGDRKRRRPRAAEAPERRKPGISKASPGAKAPIKRGGVASERRGSPKSGARGSRRRKPARPAGVR